MSADDFRRGVAGATVPALIERTFAPRKIARGDSGVAGATVPALIERYKVVGGYRIRADHVLPGLPSRPSLSGHGHPRRRRDLHGCCRGYRPGPH